MADGGFDAGAFAARMSSIGHAGNIGGESGASGGAANLAPTIGGSLATEIKGVFSGTIEESLNNLATSGVMQILPVFKISTSMLEGAQSTVKAFEALIESLGQLSPPPTPPVNLPSPEQVFVGGKKAQGQGH